MPRTFPLIVLLTAALAGAAPAAAGGLDTAKLDQVRSVTAEAALLEQAARAGRVTPAYADALRDDLRQDLQQLLDEPQVAAAARAALAALNRRDAAALAALRDRLVLLEKANGRAG